MVPRLAARAARGGRGRGRCRRGDARCRVAVVSVRPATPSLAAKCAAPANRDRRGKLPARAAPAGTSAGAGDRRHSGLRHRYQREQRRVGLFKIDTPAIKLSARHLPHGLLRRHRRSQGRDDPAVRDAAAERSRRVCATPGPASWTAATGADVGDVGCAGRRRLGNLLREAGSRGSAGRAGTGQPHRLRRPRRQRRVGLLFQTSDTTWQAYNYVRRPTACYDGQLDRAAAPTR